MALLNWNVSSWTENWPLFSELELGRCCIQSSWTDELFFMLYNFVFTSCLWKLILLFSYQNAMSLKHVNFIKDPWQGSFLRWSVEVGDKGSSWPPYLKQVILIWKWAYLKLLCPMPLLNGYLYLKIGLSLVNCSGMFLFWIQSDYRVIFHALQCSLYFMFKETELLFFSY